MNNLTSIIEHLETLLGESKEMTVQQLDKALKPLLGKAQVRAFDKSLLYTFRGDGDAFLVLQIKIEDGLLGMEQQYSLSLKKNPKKGGRVQDVKSALVRDLNTLKREIKSLKALHKEVNKIKNLNR